MSDMKVAIIGLDTSHSVAMPKLMNDPSCEPDMKVSGLKAVTCLRFETPFQGKEGLDNSQAQLEGWGVKVTLDFDEAIADCDVIMMEINDPAYHLDYFKRLANLGKPIFLDKPMAANVAESREIMDLARRYGTRVWSGSSRDGKDKRPASRHWQLLWCDGHGSGGRFADLVRCPQL